jgi:hypothetical protein
MIRVTLALFFSCALLLPAQTPDQSTTEAASRLAARISSLLPHRAISSFEFQNLTALPAAEWSTFRSQLQDELRKLGAAAGTTTQPDSRVRVTLSENSRGLLLVAEVSTGENRQVAMLPWGLPARAESKPRITLTRKLLLTQAEPILDILIVESDSEMLVLSPRQVANYRPTDGKWTPTAIASLLLPRPMPRDPRGRLETATGGFQAFLPVATCTGAWNPELKLTCENGTANWPGTSGTHWAADRNFLEGDASAGGNSGPDRESIANPCGAGLVEIASSANNEHDSVRAWDGADPASDPLPLPGPVTALWPAESRGEATLVVRNLQTGEYEASRLLVACAQ